MIELLFRLGFALACGVGAAVAVLWALIILPEWLRLRRAAAKKAAEAEGAEG